MPLIIINRSNVDLTSIMAFDIHSLAGYEEKAEEAL